MANVKDWEGHARLVALSKKEEEKHELFTPEAEARRQNRADKLFYPNSIYYNTEASRDGIRHFAWGIGDTNPLFCDTKYAKKTKYGDVVAPGCYLYTCQWLAPGGGGPGIHGWYSGGDWVWYRPIVAGDEISVICTLRDLVPKKGRMGGGRTWIDYSEVFYLNQRGELIGSELAHSGAAERAASAAAGKNLEVPKPNLTKEDWARILELYKNEEVRGATPRYWEDVQVGDTLGPMIKGPLSVRDEICWIMGGGTPWLRAHKIEYDYEAKHPKILEFANTSEADNPADVPELVHFLSEFAKSTGIERAYDYGNQRMSWMNNLFTNWMGDDGFLWKMNGDLRTFNLMGDITTFEGKVTGKHIDDGKCCVEIEAWAKNQRDQVSMPPKPATVILPSKEHGPVKYPEVPAALQEELKGAKSLEELIKL